MQITYSDFWPGFDSDKVMFERLFEDDIFKDISQIHISSVFESRMNKILRRTKTRFNIRNRWQNISSPAPSSKHEKIKKIWFTGENLRPPFPNDFDVSFSYDQDTFGAKNVYLPLFYLRLLFQTQQARHDLGAGFELESLVKRRKIDWATREQICCAFINNAEPNRLRAAEALIKLGQVDIFGKAVGRPVADKFSIAKNYKFMLCFENSIYPGYVTEKLLDAYVCGTIPIYWGDLGKNSIINPKAFINYKDFDSIEQMVQSVKLMTQNELEKMAEEPLLLKLPNLKEIRMQIHRSLAAY